jgi:3-carboxy-cis,cis-muconate cycloisomerase
VRALFAEPSQYQAWLDVEAALDRVQAELGIIPLPAAEEIARKARLELLDMAAIRAGFAVASAPGAANVRVWHLMSR